MKILLIDNYDSFTYNLVQLIEQTNLCELKVVPYHKATDELIETFDKILISPGPGIPPDFPRLETIVKKFYRTKSFLGICLGHEAIALAFGAKIYSLGRVFHGVSKKTAVVDKSNYIFQNIPDKFEGGLYHSWALEKNTLPKQLIITAVAEDGVIMAFSHKQFDLTGFQFHPESIMTKYGSQMIYNWLKH